ncbi:response regulator [Leifsonia sp. NPDC058230]|uniref:response regulator n=1 Tax=Leifsonia sp. NPDC058230 TaxID=3346391 RepID=UPI0036DA160A
MTAPIRLVIADDHPVVRDGLAGMFASDPEFLVVGEAADGYEAVELAQNLRADVVLMDLRMPRMDGLQAIAQLRAIGSAARVIVLTTYDTDADVLPALEAGAIGFLLKDAVRGDLLGAVRAAARGQTVLAPAVAGRLLGGTRAPAAQTLTARELAVLSLVADGNTNQSIAEKLYISQATVKSHLLNIYAKLGVNDRAAAVAEAFRQRLLPA